ncbi:MAG TPA: ATP-binding cassette domain-containing protein [Flavilitoribacter sp.]|nr:ATP-binding cassette domain-containing protein [Flavilitoribacter sp.]HMQ87086.1 ATP-binding cassette domain-containing protein [Flavilitoribacter sp.]
MIILQTRGLSKSYGRIQALSSLDLTVRQGMIYGILGPNGSGKTTTLGIVLGVINAGAGDYTWFEDQYGKNPRKKLGALLETPNFYPYLSGEDNLRLVAHIKKIKDPDIPGLLRLVNLLQRKDSGFRTYSLGMKQRLAIAASLIGDPEAIVLDEPTNGLDPQGIAEVRETILQIAAGGKTIIMASHILDEVEKTCTHVGILKSGQLLASGPVGAILSNDVLIELGADDLPRLREIFANFPDLKEIEEGSGKLILHFSADISAQQLNKAAFEAGLVLTHLVKRQQSLEKQFLEITRSA